MLTRKHPTDETVVTHVLSGKSDEFGILVARHRPVVHAIAFAHLRNEADAEDVVQDAFVKAYQGLDTLRERSKFRSWIGRIVQNLCADLRGKHKKEIRLTDSAATKLQTSEPDLARRELRGLLKTQVLQLDISHREVLLLHYYAEKSTHEIADILGVSNEAIKKRLQRARAALSEYLIDDLRDLLKPECDEPALTKKILALVLAAHVSWKAQAASAAVGIVSGKLALAGIALVVGFVVVAGTYLRTQTLEAPVEAAAEQTGVSGPEAEAAASIGANQPDATVAMEEPADDSNGTTHVTPVATGRRIGVVSGIVRDDRGQSVPGVQVTIKRIAFGPGKHMVEVDYVEQSETDEVGRFVIAGLPVRLDLPENESFLVSAVHGESLAWRQAHPHTKLGRGDIVLTLRPAGAIAGTVLDGAGLPIAGARIYPGKYRGPHEEVDGAVFRYAFISESVTTDAQGKFVVPHLWEGEWSFLVEADGFAPHQSSFVPVHTDNEIFTLTTGYRMYGTVVAIDSGEPVPNAGIVLVHRGDIRNRRYVRATTDTEGHFTVDHLRTGPHSVWVEDEMWAHADGAVKFDVTGGPERLAVVVLVEMGAIVEGRVYGTKSGRGISGVTVAALPRSGCGIPFSPSNAYYVAITDVDGRYRMTGLPAYCEYRFDIVKEGASRLDPRTAPALSPAAGTRTTLDIPLPTDMVFAGRVVNEKGHPLSDAQLYISSGMYKSVYVTDAGGAFSITGFEKPGASVVVVATLHGYAMAPAGPFVIPEEGLFDVILTLEPAARVDGMVVDARGRPLRDAGVTARSARTIREAYHFWMPHTRTDSQGRFTLDGLYPGEYDFTGTPPGTTHYGGRNVIGTLTLLPGDHQKGLEFSYDPGPNLTIQGKVIDRGRGTGSMVWCVGPVFTQVQASLKDNTFKLAGLSAGTYRVAATDLDGRVGAPIEVEAGTQDVELVLEKFAKISGRVLNAQSRTALSDCRFRWADGTLNTFSPKARWRDAEVEQSDDGFRLRHIPSQTLTLAVGAPGFVQQFIHLDRLRPNEEWEDLEVALEPGRVLEGVVRNSRGEPVSGAGVVEGPMLMETYLSRIEGTETEPNGRFHLEGLPSGPQTITVFHSDYASTTIEASPGQPVEIVLEQGGVLEGSVVEDGAIAPDTSVNFKVDGESIAYTKVDTEGRFRFDKVPSGEVIVSVTLGRGLEPYKVIRYARRRAAIAEGLSTNVELIAVTGNAGLQGMIDAPQEMGFVNVVIRLVNDDGSEQVYEADVSHNNLYSIEGIPAGPATLDVMTTKSDYKKTVVQTVNIELTPGEILVHDIEL